MSKKSTNHGGKRDGSGRPKKESTVVVRVPKSLVEKVKNLIANHYNKDRGSNQHEI